MILSDYATKPCPSCCMPLAEVASDLVCRVFGCVGCLRVYPAPPADEVVRYKISRRERRRQARQFAGKGRRSRCRRVPVMRETTRPPRTRWAVLPRVAFGSNAAQDIGDGWALGLLTSQDWRMFRYLNCDRLPSLRWPPSEAVDDADRIHADIVTINLKQVGGTAWGVFDDRAPESLVMRAFDRLWHERATKSLRFLFAMRDARCSLANHTATR